MEVRGCKHGSLVEQNDGTTKRYFCEAMKILHETRISDCEKFKPKGQRTITG